MSENNPGNHSKTDGEALKQTAGISVYFASQCDFTCRVNESDDRKRLQR
jgi:hypothetical protein